MSEAAPAGPVGESPPRKNHPYLNVFLVLWGIPGFHYLAYKPLARVLGEYDWIAMLLAGVWYALMLLLIYLFLLKKNQAPDHYDDGIENGALGTAEEPTSK